jgi:hypothetical protein
MVVRLQAEVTPASATMGCYMGCAKDVDVGSGMITDSAEKPQRMLRLAQHERKISNDFDNPPFVLRLSKDERRVFQQNHN